MLAHSGALHSRTGHSALSGLSSALSLPLLVLPLVLAAAVSSRLFQWRSSRSAAAGSRLCTSSASLGRGSSPLCQGHVKLSSSSSCRGELHSTMLFLLLLLLLHSAVACSEAVSCVSSLSSSVKPLRSTCARKSLIASACCGSSGSS
eukprot:5735-Heterococcus_DN1.PRE.1